MNLFDFDFEDLINFEGVDEADTTFSQSISYCESAQDEFLIAKSASGKPVTKEVIKTKRETKTKIINIKRVHQFLGVGDVKPNISRGNKSFAPLYAFPHFDKADALLYFPHSFSRHMNTGDIPSLTKLMIGHMDRACTVSVSDDSIIPLMNGQTVLQLLCLIQDLRPDLMMCVHSTKVIENQIFASAYAKTTDVPAVYDSVGSRIKNPLFRMMFARERQVRLQDVLKIAAEKQPVEELRKVEGSLESGADVLLYSAVDIVLTFDDITKKIKHLKLHTRLTSIHPAERQIQDHNI